MMLFHFRCRGFNGTAAKQDVPDEPFTCSTVTAEWIAPRWIAWIPRSIAGVLFGHASIRVAVHTNDKSQSSFSEFLSSGPVARPIRIDMPVIIVVSWRGLLWGDLLVRMQ